jgi:hypothetical protein
MPSGKKYPRAGPKGEILWGKTASAAAGIEGGALLCAMPAFNRGAQGPGEGLVIFLKCAEHAVPSRSGGRSSA